MKVDGSAAQASSLVASSEELCSAASTSASFASDNMSKQDNSELKKRSFEDLIKDLRPAGESDDVMAPEAKKATIDVSAAVEAAKQAAQRAMQSVNFSAGKSKSESRQHSFHDQPNVLSAAATSSEPTSLVDSFLRDEPSSQKVSLPFPTRLGVKKGDAGTHVPSIRQYQ